MNLIKCATCAKRSVCKFFNADDPRAIDGVCRFYLSVENIKPHEGPAKPVYKHKDMGTDLRPKTLGTDDTLQFGDIVHRIVYTTNKTNSLGYFIRTVKVKPMNIEHLLEDLGDTVFKTRKEAEDAAEIKRYTKSSTSI